jgi:hypothetical protein
MTGLISYKKIIEDKDPSCRLCCSFKKALARNVKSYGLLKRYCLIFEKQT